MLVNLQAWNHKIYCRPHFSLASAKIVARKYVPFKNLTGKWFIKTSYNVLGKSLNPNGILSQPWQL